MTEIYCKCGPQTLEDTTCAECGDTLRLRWIPVSERLPELKTYDHLDNIDCPEDETVVIALDCEGGVFPAIVTYEGMFDENDDPAEELIYGETVNFWYRNIGEDENIDVTHWMPLPPPPEDK